MLVLQIPRQLDTVGGWIDLLVLLGQAAEILVGNCCPIDSPGAEHLECFGQIEFDDELSLGRRTDKPSSGNIPLESLPELPFLGGERSGGHQDGDSRERK